MAGAASAHIALAHEAVSPEFYAGDELPCNYRRYPQGSGITRNIPDFQRRCFLQARARMQRAVGSDVNLSEAEAIVRAMLELDPSSGYGWAGLAELYLRQEDLGISQVSHWKAAEVAERATHAKPAIAEAFVALCTAQMRLGCLPCAREAIKRAKGLAPENPQMQLAEAVLLSADGDRLGAESRFSEVLERATEPQARSLTRLELAEHLTRYGDLDAAQRAFEGAAEDDPSFLVAQLRLASFLLFERGQAEAAGEAADRSGRLYATYEARRLKSLADYLKWAVQCERSDRCREILKIAQRAVVTPEEVFVLAAGHRALVPVARALLKTKTVRDLEVRDGEGNTALILAARADNLELLRTLVDQGAKLNAQNSHGARPLSLAAMKGNATAIELLLSRRAEPSFVDQDGNSPLALATLAHQGKAVVLLLRGGADPNLAGRWSANDLLNAACANGDLDSVKALLDRGVDPNAMAPEQRVPLISAVMSGSKPVVAYLLERGADPARRFAGRTAMDFAREAGDWGMIRILEAQAHRSI